MKVTIKTYQNNETGKKFPYSSQEICPVCGIYSADGGVCSNCLKEHGLYEPKVLYIEV